MELWEHVWSWIDKSSRLAWISAMAFSESGEGAGEVYVTIRQTQRPSRPGLE